ncbi:hypothetical protein MKX01_013163 [Papaver californicum]|nr:hypothetical protein MKX01_013163 [Papaver californicum]
MSSANSIRRTLSAVDMSSPLKRIASSDELQIDHNDIQQKDDFPQQQQQQEGQFDIWCSILIQKPSSLPPPYVHPLVKQSKSCLSLKSLEICTENLGSESGSDGYPHSDISLCDTEEEDEEIQEVVEEEATEQVVVEEKKKEVVAVMNYSKKSSSVIRSFPPPLKSLSKPGGGGIQMKTHRKDGRLILEAVSVPTSTNCFNAQRRDGRLLLTFASPIQEPIDNNEEDDEEVEFECIHYEQIEHDQEKGPIIEEEEDKAIVLEMTSARVPKLPTGLINVHRSALMVNKFAGLTNNRSNITSCWSSSSSSTNLKNKLEKMMNSPSTKLVLPQSLPTSSPPTLLAGAPRKLSSSRLVPPQQTVAEAEDPSFNRYEYCWRKDTTIPVSGIHHLLNQEPTNKNNYHNNNSNNLIRNKNNYYNNNNSNNFFTKDSTTTTANGGKYYKEEKQINGNGEKVVDQHLIVLLPAYCKPEPRRFWEPPHCIATS